MTRDSASQAYPSTLSAFWYLISFPGSYVVRVAAALAILLCVVYSMGLGGVVLWISSSAASFFGSAWSPYALPPLARAALGTAWVVVFTFMFMNMMLSIFLRQPPFPSLLRLLRSHRELRDDQVSAVMDDWLDSLTVGSRPAAAVGTRITGQVDAG